MATDAALVAPHIIMVPGVRGVDQSRIAGKGFKVRILVEFIRSGLTPDDLVREFDLTLAEVHAGLSYYYDHQEELDAEIAEGAQFEAEFRKTLPRSPLRDEWERRHPPESAGG